MSRNTNSDVAIELDHHKRTILPVAGRKNVLITSALPYVNNIPHLGNIIGCVLSADVYARYCRLRGYNTLYVCGTDEYGTATETKAIQEGLSCQEICDKYHRLHKETYDWFDIDFDIFGRTSTDEQTKITQDIFKKLDERGKTEHETVTQLYCEVHNSFLADRFVNGICPNCAYDDAGGDQCDKCGKLLNATELIEPRCKLDGAKPVKRDSRHIFLNLTDAQEVLEEWVNKSSAEGKWSANSTQITKAWLKEGLKPRCITRDLKWGVKVPKEEFKDKVFYVWFDAPIGYISITAAYTEEWQKWWKNPDNVKLYQFMGKDNVPFHTVLFPSSLIGTGEKYTLLHHVSTTEYLQYENTKFSKSRGVGVFGNNVSDSQIPVDVWRYFLLLNRPETADSQFAWTPFILANNSELLANLGNFVNRVMKFATAKYNGVVPEYKVDGDVEKKFIADVNEILANYIENLETCNSIRAGLRCFMNISSLGNGYLQDNKIDNTLFTNSRSRCDIVVATALNLAYLLSALVYPYLPRTSANIIRQLNAPTRRITDTWNATDLYGGHVLGKVEYLFTHIDEKRAGDLRAKYSGLAQNATTSVKPVASSAPAKNTSGAKAVLLSEAPAGFEKTARVIELEATIKAAGETVRKLKIEKVTGDALQAALAILTENKESLTAEVAKLGGGSPVIVSAEKKKKVKKAVVTSKVEHVVAPAVTPVILEKSDTVVPLTVLPLAVEKSDTTGAVIAVLAAEDLKEQLQHLWTGWGWIIRD
ncbi:putative methionine--tRNA ligase, cytoplasmic protein rar1 [Physocladia obscura]|uniref:methionine--tRNA ligase n=1 Tax=Physocladia obscura TaxID=109957 RepID=A0AAD5T616_9FUNG|nr:putative methionine--tRNA ligase, cytoplasmic protein rar1 [Physocladia obscura]